MHADQFTTVIGNQTKPHSQVLIFLFRNDFSTFPPNVALSLSLSLNRKHMSLFTFLDNYRYFCLHLMVKMQTGGGRAYDRRRNLKQNPAWNQTRLQS